MTVTGAEYPTGLGAEYKRAEAFDVVNLGPVHVACGAL